MSKSTPGEQIANTKKRLKDAVGTKTLRSKLIAREWLSDDAKSVYAEANSDNAEAFVLQHLDSPVRVKEYDNDLVEEGVAFGFEDGTIVVFGIEHAEVGGPSAATFFGVYTEKTVGQAIKEFSNGFKDTDSDDEWD